MEVQDKLNIFAPCCRTEKIGTWSRAPLSFFKTGEEQDSPAERGVTFWAEIAWAQTGMKYSGEEYKITL